MQIITYDDKVALNQNAAIPSVNKCNASDLNEIKSVVNNNAIDCGNISDLTTTVKTSLVDAINEVKTEVGTKQATILTGTSLPATGTDGDIFLLYNS